MGQQHQAAEEPRGPMAILMQLLPLLILISLMFFSFTSNEEALYRCADTYLAFRVTDLKLALHLTQHQCMYSHTVASKVSESPTFSSFCHLP